ncbi:MAG: site-specific DNA-methyltransferase [Mariniphaga sp.]
MTGNSQVPKDVLLDNLRQLAPEIFTEGKVDWERLKATLGEEVEFSNERYVLNWAGKSDAFRVLQTPSTRTLAPAKEESVDFETTGNIFIEGENLEVLKILQKSYFGKIKMIYIDPPYNTGNDAFIYPDKFSETKDEYQKRVGDKDEEGYMTREGMFRKNSRENGQYHSNWLNMMYPRLFLARNLLRDDGVIFVSIDDNEVHNLRLMMNEIFGEENWIGTVIWKNATDNNPTQIAVEHEYMQVYSKNRTFTEAEWKSSISDVKQILVNIGNKLIKKHKNLDLLKAEYEIWYKENKAFLSPLDRYKYIDFDGIYTGSQSVHNPGKEGYRYDVIHPLTGKPCKQPLMGYRFPKETMDKLLKEDKVLFGDDENKIIELKVYAKDFQEKFSSVLELDGRLGSYDLKTLFPESSRLFNNPKPVRFLLEFFPFILKENDIILDFYSGSASSSHAVYELNKRDGKNRKFISVQLPEKTEEKTEAFQAGYNTIADIAKERIKRVIQKIKEEKKGQLDFNPQEKQDLGFKVFKLSESNFKIWRSRGIETAEELEKQMALFTDPVSENAAAEPMVYELMLKSGFDLNSPLEKQNGVYRIGDGEMALLIETVSEELIGEVIQSQPQKVIALDRLFEGNDQLKTNTALQMKDANIDFKTI